MKLKVSVAACWSGLAAVLAHVLSYRLVYEDPHARMHALESSGHSWYALLIPAFAAMALAAVAGTIITSQRLVKMASSLQMYTISAAGFLVVEFFERYMHLRSIEEVWHNVSTGSGFLPILIALVLLLPIVPLFYVAAKTISTLARRKSNLPPAALVITHRDVEFRLPAVFSFATAPRGPPCLVVQIPVLR